MQKRPLPIGKGLANNCYVANKAESGKTPR